MQALYHRATNTVRTFVRDDHRATAPDGWEFVDRESLTAGWAMEVSPVPAREWTAAQFLARFTDAEQDAIEGSELLVARKARRTLYTNTEVRSDSNNLISLLSGLVQAGLITQDRMNDIINPDWSL